MQIHKKKIPNTALQCISNKIVLAIESTDRKVLKCHTTELSFKVQVSVIDQEVYF